MCKTTTTTETYDDNESLVSRTVDTKECCTDECLCKGVHDYAEPKYSDDGQTVLFTPCDRKHVDDFPSYWPGPYISTTGINPGDQYTFRTTNCSHSKPTEGCACNGHR